MYLNKQSLAAEISKLLPNYKTESFLLAVSGGADSMVLLQLFLELKLSLQVAHVNYKLRGEASDEDQKLVASFCAEHQLKLHIYEVSAKDKKPENSIQIWARELRYRFFSKIKKEQNLRFLATAHHLNDDLESFLINLSRASGLAGLSGIAPNKNEILRPLLKFSKSEIYDYASRHNVHFREDESNQKPDYLRNFIRLEILPKLAQTNANFLENFSKSLTYIKDAGNFIEDEITAKRKKYFKIIDGCTVIKKSDIEKESDFVKFQLLKVFGFSQPEEIKKIFRAENGRIFQRENYEIRLTAVELIIKPKNILLENFQPILLPKNQQIEIQSYVSGLKKRNSVWKFNVNEINFPLKVRDFTPQDYFQPAGMLGRKKISKFVRELKLSLEDDQPLVLCDANENILGVLPYRQSGLFPPDQKDKILEISF